MEKDDIKQQRKMLIRTIICILNGTTYYECDIILREVQDFLKNDFETKQLYMKLEISEDNLSYLLKKYK